MGEMDRNRNHPVQMMIHSQSAMVAPGDGHSRHSTGIGDQGGNVIPQQISPSDVEPHFSLHPTNMEMDDEGQSFAPSGGKAK